MVSWAYDQIYDCGRLAAELNQLLISEVEGKLEQNEKKSERKCHHFEKTTQKVTLGTMASACCRFRQEINDLGEFRMEFRRSAPHHKRTRRKRRSHYNMPVQKCSRYVA